MSLPLVRNLLLVLVLPALPALAEEGSTGAAERALASGDLQRARELFQERIARQPENPEGYLGLARTLEAQGQEGAAATLLTGRGERWIQSGEYPLAAVVLEELARLRPEAGDVHALLGRVYALDRRYLAAELSLERAVELGRGDPRTLFYLGSARWENGDLEGAEAIYREAVGRSGRASFPVQQLGRLQLWQGRYQEAASLLREALAKGADGFDVRLDLARALEGVGEVEAALEAYRELVELAPESTKAHYGLARLLNRLGEAEAARRELEVYRRLYEEDQERTRQQGLLQAELDYARDLTGRGEVEAAIAHLRQLPETVDGLVALARTLSLAGRHGEAVASLERAVALAPDQGELRSLLAEARLAAERSG